jgi:hypothetical protein
VPQAPLRALQVALGAAGDLRAEAAGHLQRVLEAHGGAVANDVEIGCGALSGGVKVPAQAARSIG